VFAGEGEVALAMTENDPARPGGHARPDRPRAGSGLRGRPPRWAGSRRHHRPAARGGGRRVRGQTQLVSAPPASGSPATSKIVQPLQRGPHRLVRRQPPLPVAGRHAGAVHAGGRRQAEQGLVAARWPGRRADSHASPRQVPGHVGAVPAGVALEVRALVGPAPARTSRATCRCRACRC